MASQDYDFTNKSFNGDKKALVPRSFRSFSDLSKYKVSLHNGFAAKINGSSEDYSWLFQVIFKTFLLLLTLKLSK